MKTARAVTSTSKPTVVLVFIPVVRRSLGAALPPHRCACYRRDERHQDENDPAQAAQCTVVEREGERLLHFRRDPDELLAIQQPVDRRGNKVEPLLILGERVVLSKR